MTDRELENAGLAQLGERAPCKREVAGSNPAPGSTGDAFSLIAQAVQAGQIDVGVIERLCALQERVQAQAAKADFIRAMADFQAECPVIEKRKPAKDRNGKTMYFFAPMDDIVRQVGGLIAKHGFGYGFDQKVTDDGKGMAVTCKVTHIGGHSESASFFSPFGAGTPMMSEMQKHGSASTFAKRYAFCAAFGISTGDEDTDGAKDDGGTPMDEADYQRHCDAIDAAGDFTTLSKAVEEAKNAAGAAGDRVAFGMFRQRGAARFRELPTDAR